MELNNYKMDYNLRIKKLKKRENKMDYNLKARKLVEQVMGEDNFALMWASKYGKIDMIKFVLKRGVDVNVKDEDGYTALMYAEENGDKDIIDLLKSHGAK